MTSVRKSPSGGREDVGGGAPLTEVFYIDQGAAPGGDGSIATPFPSFAVGLAQGGLLATYYVAPGDYSAEPTLAIGTNSKLGIIGLTKPINDQFTSRAVVIPGIEQTTGGEIGSLWLQNLVFSATAGLASSLVQIRDCLSVAIGPNLAGERASNLLIQGGSTQFVDAIGARFEDTLFLALASVLASGDALTFINCAGSGVQVGVEFTGAPGTLFFDLATEQAFGSPAAIAALVNGVAQRVSLPVQSITGVTEQNQIDSIVAAGVALGLWTDDR